MFPRSRLSEWVQRGCTQNPEVLKALAYGVDKNTAGWCLAKKAQIRVIPSLTCIQKENLLKFNHEAGKSSGVVPHSELARFPCPLPGHCSDSTVQVTAIEKFFWTI